MVFDIKIVDAIALSAMTNDIQAALSDFSCLANTGQKVLVNETNANALLLPYTKLEEISEARDVLTPKIPAMLSRRLTPGAKYAVQLASFFKDYPLDAVVFSSRHGELKRNEKILLNIAHNENVSPTDFSMSVHNVAVSQFLIAHQLRLPYTSIAAGAQTFVQSLYEIESFLLAGYKNILYVDFDSEIPEGFKAHIGPDVSSLSYACAFIMQRGGKLELKTELSDESIKTHCPQSLQFYGAWALGRKMIKLHSNKGLVTTINQQI